MAVLVGLLLAAGGAGAWLATRVSDNSEPVNPGGTAAVQLTTTIPIDTVRLETKPLLSASTPRPLTELPRPTPTPDTLIFFDGFDVNNGWNVKEYPNSHASVSRGRIILTLDKPNIVHWRENPNVIVRNFRLRVDAKPLVQSDEEYAYGVCFRWQESGYCFGLSNWGRYEFVVHPDQRKPIDWTHNPAINTDDTNIIEVTMIDDLVSFTVNGTNVDTVIDNALTRGHVRLYVSTMGGGDNAMAEFDNLRIETR